MDYHLIYREFIKDRREKEPGLAGYVERHHILPRSLGGQDCPDNLISLTPEDHFFAHLLLAKTHGGRLWAAVAFMLGGDRKHYRPIQSRKAFGWVRRAMVKATSGENAHQFDFSTYTLRHKDGAVWVGRQSEMPDLGVSKSLANMLIKGRVKTAKGWYLADRPEPSRGGSSHPMFRGEEMHFRHTDGREFKGTQHDLHVTYGLSRSMACRLARGQFRTAKGWYVDGTKPAKVGRGAARKDAG